MRFLGLIILSWSVLCISGCKTEPADEPAHQHAHDEDGGHNHGDHGHHDHPLHGPNHGHLFEFESDEFQGEWSKNKTNNDIITMYLLTKDKEPKPVTLKVNSFKVTPLAGSDAEPFELEPLELDDDGKASAFVLESAELRMAIPLSGVQVEVVMPDQSITGKIEAHEPMDH